jgi:hypothetical protein
MVRMRRKFEELSETGRKIGEEPPPVRVGGMDDVDHPEELDVEDETCGRAEEGQDPLADDTDEESGKQLRSQKSI